MSAVIGALRVDLGMNSTAFLRGVNEAQRRLAGMQRRFAKVGAQLTGIGRAMSIGVTAPVVAFGALALKAGGDFEAAMNRVGAITGATGGDLTRLSDAAKQMGRETQFSASQAADALGFLGMAGFNAGQAVEALPGTLQLAAAAQMDLAQSADIVSNVLSGYGMQVGELARVNDVLVKTFTSSNTDLVQLGEAMKYAGPIASAAGVSFEEAAAAIGMMGNAGIQASMAGTSLRGAIGRILAPTGAASARMRELGLNFTDAAGKILPLDQILDQLAPHADNAGLFMDLFGQRAGPAMAALVSQGADALRDLRGELVNAGGTAERIAAAQMEGFNGAMKRLASAFEAVRIAIAESGLLEAATKFADGLARVLSRISEANPQLLRLGTIVAGVVAVIGPLALIAGAVATGIAAIAPVAITVAAGLGQLAIVGAAVAAAWGPITAAAGFLRENLWLLTPVVGVLTRSLVASLVPALLAASRGLVGMAAAAGARLVAGLRLASASLWGFKAALVSTGIGAIVVGLGLAAEGFMRLSRAAGGAGNAFIVMKAIAREAVGRIGDLWQGMKAQSGAAWEGIKAGALGALANLFSGVASIVNKIIGAFVGAQAAIATAWAQLPRALASVVASAANAVIEGVEKAINKSVELINRFVSSLPAKAREFLGWSAIGSVAIDRVSVTATDAVGAVQTAFQSAFNRDYVGPLTDGVQGLADGARDTAAALEEAGRAHMEAATAPLQSVAALREAQRMLAREGREGAGDLADATAEAEAQAEALEAALADAGDAGEDLGGGASRGARQLASDLKGAAAAAKEAGDAAINAGKSFVSDLVTTDPASAAGNLWDSLKSTAGQALSSAVFNPGGIVAGFAGAAQQVSAGLSGLAAGGGLAALGTAIGGALPFIGAGIAIFNLIKGFAKTEQIGSGLKLSIEGGALDGQAYDEFKRTTFWGLFSREYDEDRDLPTQLARSLKRQATAVKKSVTEVYDRLGIEVPESLLNRVRMTMRRIETEGLSKDEIAGQVSKFFDQYAGALSNAVAKMGAQAAEALLGAQTALDPIGKMFDLFANTSRRAGQADLAKFGRAAKNLAGRFGGIEGLAQATGAYFDGFFTDQEKVDYMRRQVGATFKELGRAVPKTDEEFRRLVQTQNLLTQSGRRTFSALLEIAPVFDTLTDALEEQANRVSDVLAILKPLGQSIRASLAEELAAAAGGLTELGTKVGAFFEAFFSPAEKLAYLRSRVASVFEELGLAVPKTDKEFRALVLAQDLVTKAGRETYAALLEIAPVFDEVTDQLIGAAGALRNAYAFDVSGYATAWEAKLADEMQNAGRYSGELITSQNNELAKQTALLEQIRLSVGRSANAAEDSNFVGQWG